MKPVTKNK